MLCDAADAYGLSGIYGWGSCHAVHRSGGSADCASGSGTTGSLARIAEKAISLGAELAVVTICPEGIIGSMASVTVKIDAPVCKTGDQQQPGSIQPMANLFEQCLLICLDYVVMILMDMTGVTSEQMYRRHANLE